jgi:histidine triad (HIT) family protein
MVGRVRAGETGETSVARRRRSRVAAVASPSSRPMASIFTKILNREIPGRFVWKDEQCFAILTINPIQPGHLLVIPREEIDNWVYVPDALRDHLFKVGQTLAKALMKAYRPVKVGLMIVGLEVKHVHLHLMPISAPEHVEFARADKNPDPKALDAAAAKIRAALKEMGVQQIAG